MHIDLNKVQKNRRKIIKTAIENNAFNLDVYSEFFEIKQKVLIKDIKALNLEHKNLYAKNISLEKLQAKRDNTINKQIQEGKSWQEAIAKVGMWHKPFSIPDVSESLFMIKEINKFTKDEKDLKNALISYKNEPNDKTRIKLIKIFNNRIPHFSEAVSMLQHGATHTEIAKRYKYTQFQTTQFSKIVKNIGIEGTPDKIFLKYPEVKEALKDILQWAKEASPARNVRYAHQISDITGILWHKINDLQKTDLDALEDKINSIQSYTKNVYSLEIEARQKEVWNMYYGHGSTHGYTMQEIADKLGITRHTVSTDLRTYKLNHPEEIDITQLYIPRHRGIEALEKRNALIETLCAYYDNCSDELSHSQKLKEVQTKIEKTQSRSYNTSLIHAYLIEGGRYIPKAYKNATIDEYVQYEAKEGYDNKGQFGDGATREILDHYNIPKGSDLEKKERPKVLRHQKNSMAVMRNNPKIKQKFEENGILKEALQEEIEID